MSFLIQIVGGDEINRFRIESGFTTIGRNANNTIVISDATVSGTHAVISSRSHAGTFSYEIKDVNSTNGIYINNERVDEKRELQDSDEIKIGKSTFIFSEREYAKALEGTMHCLFADEIP